MVLMKNEGLAIRKRAYFWAPVVVWAGLIFILSSHQTGTAVEIVWTDFILKKSAHIVEYGILTALMYRALLGSGVERKRAGWWAIGFSVLYGLSDEFHQSFTPGRDGRLRDVVFDTIGALTAVYIIWNTLPKAPARLRNWARRWELV